MRLRLIIVGLFCLAMISCAEQDPIRVAQSDAAADTLSTIDIFYNCSWTVPNELATANICYTVKFWATTSFNDFYYLHEDERHYLVDDHAAALAFNSISTEQNRVSDSTALIFADMLSRKLDYDDLKYILDGSPLELWKYSRVSFSVDTLLPGARPARGCDTTILLCWHDRQGNGHTFDLSAYDRGEDRGR
jgi:hypothetical protein